MGYPNGVSLAVISGGTAFTAFGDDVPVQITVTPRFPKQGGGFLTRIIHAATGWVMTSDPDTFTAEAGSEVSFSVPHVDQAGFRDPAQNAYTGWYYEVKVVVGAARGRTKTAYTQTVSPAVGQALVDLDLVPEGQTGNPQSVTVPEVLSVNGQTGAVVIETASDIDIAGMLRDPATETGATLASQIDARSSDAWDSVFASLDMREQREITIAHASDSTGDQATEYFESGLSSALSEKWPERPSRLKRWVLANNAYGSWISWGDGDGGTTTSYPEVFFDDFNRADSADGAIGPGWGANTAYKISSNALTMNPSQAVTELLSTASAPDGDYRLSVTMNRGSGSTTGLIFHAIDAMNYYAVRANNTGNVLLYKVVAGVTTSLFGLDGAWSSDGQELAIERRGGRFYVYVGGSEILNASGEDAALASGRKVGVRAASGATPPTWDDFKLTGITSTTTPATVPSVTVYNGAAAGRTAEYQRQYLAAAFPARPDILFINHGHNYTTPGDIDGFLASLQGLVDDLNGLYPGDPIPVVVTSQNPQHGSSTESDHLARMMALRSYADRKGWGYIPTFEAFASLPDGGASQLSDTVHPAEGTGRVLMASVAKEWVISQSRR